MVLTGENRNNRRKTSASFYLFTVKSSQIGLGSKPGFRYERLATNMLSHAVYLERHVISSTILQ
jgi:hypothetical protein